MTKRRQANKPKVYRAFTKNHVLWNQVIEMRNAHATWGSILTYTAEHGHRLTKRQIEFGLQSAGIEYARHVIPWINDAANEFVESSLPALEYAQAALQSQATIVTDMERYCDTTLEEYELLGQPLPQPATAEQESVRIDAREKARERWIKGLNRRYTMMTEYLANLILFRRAMTDLLPAEAVREMEKTEKGNEVTAGGLMQIHDQDIFWYEAKKLEQTVRRDFEILLAAAKRGENIPDLRPLGPSAVVESIAIEEAPDEQVEPDTNA